jgi:GAF domain-containing protein
VARNRRPLLADLRDRASLVTDDQPDHARTLAQAGFRSSVCVPLESRDHVLGTLTLIVGEESGPYGAAHLGNAVELAKRVSQALDNARAHRAALRQAREARGGRAPQPLSPTPVEAIADIRSESARA